MVRLGDPFVVLGREAPGARDWPASQQKDHLCGPFVAARALGRAGVAGAGGAPVSQEELAVLAGTVLPDDAAPAAPAGAASDPPMGLPLRHARAAASGTAAPSLARAIEEASSGTLCCVGVRAPVGAALLATLLVEVRALDDRVALLANLRTGRLWGTRPTPDLLLAELRGRHREGPPPEWDTGHYCELSELVRGSGGSLVVVEDTYPTLGWRGWHLQPLRAVLSALARGDGREGGVLVVVPQGLAGAARALVDAAGGVVGFWDNGTEEAS
jgi:hypothetical protein